MTAVGLTCNHGGAFFYIYKTPNDTNVLLHAPWDFDKITTFEMREEFQEQQNYFSALVATLDFGQKPSSAREETFLRRKV